MIRTGAGIVDKTESRMSDGEEDSTAREIESTYRG